ncbi:MAG: response regulator [Paracoccaceae bacterium]
MPDPVPRLSTPPSLPVPALNALPLQGVTILAVEDSRFASEAIRLMCRRTGARLRRAETLADAGRHLHVYRPDAVIVDLGLPDGRGEGLIHHLSLSPRRPDLVLGMSGDAGGRDMALLAGADGFLEKPLASLDAFRQAFAGLIRLPFGEEDRAVLPPPDRLALRDDLHRAAGLVAAGPDAVGRRYLRGFLGGIARAADDPVLAEAARAAEGREGMDRLAQVLSQRLKKAAGDFPRGEMPLS